MPRSDHPAGTLDHRSTAPPTPAGVDPRPRQRLEVLDGFRLVAALMVLAYHYTYRAPQAWGRPAPEVFPHLARVSGYGFLGVDLFFVISGFVICMSAWDRPLRAFAISRCTRLYPGYWFAVLATSAVLAVAGRPHPGPLSSLVNLSMLHEVVGVPPVDGVYWTLTLELHFYLIFGFVVRRGLTPGRVTAFCLVWAGAAIIALLSGVRALYAVTDARYAPLFIAGVMLYLIYRFGATSSRWLILAGAAALSCYNLRHVFDFVAASRDTPLSWPVALGVVGGIYAAMTLVALRRLSWVRGAWLTVAGTLTYPLYLLHQQIGFVVIEILRTRMRHPLLVVAVTTALMLALALLVHHGVERPVASRLRRLLGLVPGRERPAGRRHTAPAERHRAPDPATTQIPVANLKPDTRYV